MLYALRLSKGDKNLEYQYQNTPKLVVEEMVVREVKWGVVVVVENREKYLEEKVKVDHETGTRKSLIPGKCPKTGLYQDLPPG